MKKSFSWHSGYRVKYMKLYHDTVLQEDAKMVKYFKARYGEPTGTMDPQVVPPRLVALSYSPVQITEMLPKDRAVLFEYRYGIPCHGSLEEIARSFRALDQDDIDVAVKNDHGRYLKYVTAVDRDALTLLQDERFRHDIARLRGMTAMQQADWFRQKTGASPVQGDFDEDHGFNLKV